MSTNLPNSRRRDFHTVRQAAWILGVPRHRVSRAIRLGQLRTSRRRARLVISAKELAKHLPRPGGDT